MVQFDEVDKGRACPRTQLTLDMVRKFVETPPKPADNFQIVCWDYPQAVDVKERIDAMNLPAEVKLIESMDFGRHDPTGEPIYSVIVRRKL